MAPFTAISTAIAKTFTFSGRASRGEYWWYFALYTIALIVCAFMDAAMVIGLVEQGGEQALASLGIFDLKSTFACLILVPPMISLTVRRLHDAGFSGFWTLIYFIPLGGFALLIMHMLPSTSTTTAYGKAAARPDADPAGKPLTVDAHKRAMQGYALLFETDKKPTAETQAARKAEIGEYYRKQVLKAAPSV